MSEIATTIATYANQQAAKAVVDAIKTDTTSILQKLGNVAATVGTVRHARVKTSANGASLYFGDPKDAEINGLYTAFWSQTVIVRKNGSAPTSPTDGTVVLTNTTRNAYLETPFVDSAYTSGDVYRAFCYSTNGAVNSSTDGIFRSYVLYGFFCDETDANENTAVHYLGDCANFARGYMDFANDRWEWGDWQGAFFHPSPCMLKTNGTVDYYLDPSNYKKRADGVTASDVTDSSYDGNAMMEWSPVYVKIEKPSADSAGWYCWVSDVKVDENFECWSAKKADGTYAPHWYTAIYEGSVFSSKLRSLSTDALPNCQTNATNELTYARANGADYTPSTYADETLITLLGVLVTGRLNFQESICGAYTSASARSIKCGSADAKGPFYGVNDGSYISNKMFGMENKFGHLWNRVVGCTLIDGEWYVKLTKSTIDGSSVGDFVTADAASAYAGYIATALTCPYGNPGYITQLGKNNIAATLPIRTGGTTTSYYCDGEYSTSGTRGVLLGGDLASGLLAGRFACNASRAPSSPLWDFSASLSCKPF